MYIYSMMDMSTEHITKETAELLEQNKIDAIVYYAKLVDRGDCTKGCYGWFIHIPEDELEYDALKRELPSELYNIIDFAYRYGCAWINMDCDGEIIDELPTYEW